MHQKNYFCYEIYKNISVWSFDGTVRYNPCSFYNGYIGQDNKFDISLIWNNKHHQQLKTLIENDSPIPGCKYCYNAEHSNLESRRQGAKKSWEIFRRDIQINLSSPQSLDYSVGNLCNLKCMICGPRNSTSWLSDYAKLYPEANLDRYKFDKFNQIEVENEEFLKNIINVHFHGGGEPFMSASHINLLRAIDKVRGLNDVRIFYNTNGTIKVSDEVLSLWEKCKLVELYFSVDDVGDRFEYQRTGAKWQEVCENIEWYKKTAPNNYMYNLNCVWGYLNLYYLNELIDWYEVNHKSNRLGDPTNLIFQKALGSYGIPYISTVIQQKLIKRFENYKQVTELIMSIPINNSGGHEHFWKTVNAIDKIRGNNFKTLCSEWSSLL